MKNMKKLIILFTAIFAFIGFTAMQTKNAEIKFEKETHDFGTIKRSVPAVYEFKFTNTGTDPLILSGVKSTCGCSVADFPKTAIAPGASGVIKVTFDALTVSPFTKSFTVSSNAKTPVKSLYIKGIVE